MSKPESICVTGSALLVALSFLAMGAVEYWLWGAWFARLASMLGWYGPLVGIPLIVVLGWMPVRDLYRWYLGLCMLPRGERS